MTATDGVTRHHGDDGFGNGTDLPLHVQNIQTGNADFTDVSGMAAHFLVVARAKGIGTLSRQDDDADLGILTANFERIVQFDDSLRTKGLISSRVELIG